MNLVNFVRAGPLVDSDTAGPISLTIKRNRHNVFSIIYNTEHSQDSELFQIVSDYIYKKNT